LSKAVAELLTPSEMKAKVDVIFQTMESLHAACPSTTGDWYFTGDYPTPGGERVLQQAIDNYLSRRDGRSY